MAVKPYEPLSHRHPGQCPRCGQVLSMVYKEVDAIYGLLDIDGSVAEINADVNPPVFTCLQCGFTTTRYVMTDQGWRYDFFNEPDFIKKLNQTHGDSDVLKTNPLVKEYKVGDTTITTF